MLFNRVIIGSRNDLLTEPPGILFRELSSKYENLLKINAFTKVFTKISATFDRTPCVDKVQANTNTDTVCSMYSYNQKHFM